MHVVQAVFKSIPAIYLSWTTYSGNTNNYQRNMAKGLIFCALGDFLLHMEDDPKYGDELWFLSGLVSFLVGHIFFMFGMSTRSIDFEKSGLSINTIPIKLFIIVYVVCMVKVLIPGIDDPVLKVGVCVYAFIIGRMFMYALIITG